LRPGVDGIFNLHRNRLQLEKKVPGVFRHDEEVQLPEPVKRRVEERANEVGFAALKRAADAMSEAYRAGAAAKLAPAERAAAYLATRMPATYAAASRVLREVAGRLAGAAVSSVLDIGAGTGAAALAAREQFPDARLTMLERDAAFSEAAREFLPTAQLLSTGLAGMAEFPPHDLVIAAYSLGELRRPPIAALWRAARVALVIIEPGSTKGFALVRAAREELLASGARMVAPCPAETACPMAGPDWCHFAARVERSAIHRKLKGAELNYEDEKFSYVALARGAVELAPARVIRRPDQKPGLITLELCAAAGLRTVRALKRDREAFRAARKTAWGDEWLG
jgi:ribosomal protein RSM22 (predicted rRNA methylase)